MALAPCWAPSSFSNPHKHRAKRRYRRTRTNDQHIFLVVAHIAGLQITDAIPWIGALEFHLDVPAMDRGSAALVISGASDLGRAEIKQLL